MNEQLRSTSFGATQPVEIPIAPTAMWASLTERLAKHRFVHGVLKGRRELPLFCNPLVIFVLNWALMLLSLSFQVTYVSYPKMGIPILLFVLSLGSFLFGYLVARTLLHRWPTRSEALPYALDVTRLWQANLLFCGAAVLIIVFNWALSGPPPAVGDPTSYLTYGRFKQVLFPLLVVVTVNSMLDASRWRKALFCMFGAWTADGSAAADDVCLRAEDANEQKEALWDCGCLSSSRGCRDYPDRECANGTGSLPGVPADTAQVL
jgi:hypothetical protein